MADIPPLEALGTRIWVTGPSAGGKSTLARAVGRRLDLPVIHLDQLCFVPGSNWTPRPDGDFNADIEAAACGDRWVIDGNYFSLGPSRFDRATGAISLATPRLGNFMRYLGRSLERQPRIGGLAGAGNRPSWEMTRWILWREPRRRQAKRERLRASGLPLVETNSLADLNRLYRAWRLSRDG